MKTPEGKIKYVYKGELLTAEEFIKAQDDKIRELQTIIEQKDKVIAELRSRIQQKKNEEEIVTFTLNKHPNEITQ